MHSRNDRDEFVPFAPEQQISTGVSWQFLPLWYLHLVGDYQGRQYYTGNRKDTLEPYFDVGAKVTYQPKDFLTLYILIDNVLNDNYEIVHGYSNQSRSALAGIMVRF